MYARVSAFAVWALLAGSVVFWLLKLTVNPLSTPTQAVAALSGTPARADLSRLLGSTPVDAVQEVVSSAASRFQLLGVVAPKTNANSTEGVAVISVDGKPARAYRLGAVVDADLRLLHVSSRSAALGDKDKAESTHLMLQLAPPVPAPPRPGVNVSSAGNLTNQRNLPADTLSTANRIAPVTMTQGLNPVPVASDGQPSDSQEEPSGHMTTNADLKR